MNILNKIFTDTNVQNNLNNLANQTPLSAPARDMQLGLIDFIKEVNTIKGRNYFYELVGMFKQTFKENNKQFESIIQKRQLNQSGLITDNDTAEVDPSINTTVTDILGTTVKDVKSSNSESVDLITKDFSKIFGEWGEKGITITPNSVMENILKIYPNVIEFYGNHPELVNTTLKYGHSVITPLLVYRGLLKTYNNITKDNFNVQLKEIGKNELLKLKLINNQRLERLSFYYIAAPILTSIFITINNSLLNKIVNSSNISDLTEDTGNTDLSNVTLTNASFFVLISKIKAKMSKNWFTIFIFFVLTVKFIFSKDNTIYPLSFDFKFINMQWFLIISLVLIFFIIAYEVLSLILCILFSKGKIKIPRYLPSFVLNWLEVLQALGALEDKTIFVNYYFKHIAIFVFIFIIISLTYYFY